MSVLQYKYKAHRLVNSIFYIIIFLIGFLLGYGANKIDFNKLINQFLMIESVQAYDVSQSNFEFNEEKIVNLFNKYFDDEFSNYSNVLVNISSVSIEIFYLPDDFTNYLTFKNTQDSYYIYTLTNNPGYYRIYSNDYTKFNNNDLSAYNFISSDTSSFDVYYGKGDYQYWGYTSVGLTFPGATGLKYPEVLDFNKYTIDFDLNDGSIFEDQDHIDFNKFCWNGFEELMFSVTIDSSYDGSYNIKYDDQQDGETYVESGFYVFDDISKLKRGTRIKALGSFDYEHYGSTWLSGATFEHLKYITSDFYLMNSEELLGARYSDPIDALGNYDIARGDSYYYDNLDKLLNATYVDFTYYLNVLDDFRYDIFYLNESKEKFCIYIPKQFIVTTLSINELGGFIGDIPTHNDDKDVFIDFSEASGQLHYNNLFSVISQFIDSIIDTVNLINNYIYSLFMSMPPLFQMFIFTIITLIVIKTIIWMVVR